MQDEKTTVTIRGKSASSYPEPRKFSVSLPATPWDNEHKNVRSGVLAEADTLINI